MNTKFKKIFPDLLINVGIIIFAIFINRSITLSAHSLGISMQKYSENISKLYRNPSTTTNFLATAWLYF